jgi:hypothetical protein
MADEHSIRRYRQWYAKLLHLYPKPYRERFGEGMEQTFNDLLQERAEEGTGVFGSALWMFLETSAGIIRVNMSSVKNRNIIGIALATAFLLLIPLVAMQFTDEVVWTLRDFVFAGVLLFGTGLTYELVTRKAVNRAYRLAVGVALATAFLLVWANAAVGIIGSEDNPANLMYIGVLVVGIIGAFIARLEPHGMAQALFATALAQILVAVIAQLAGLVPVDAPPGRGLTFLLNGFFAALWVGSASLFRRASV